MQNLGTKGVSSAVFWLLLLRTILHTFFHVTLILFSSFCLVCLVFFLQLPCFFVIFFFADSEGKSHASAATGLFMAVYIF